eukprot:3446657-Heterocapsa_arctica.AAC.1
MRSVRCGRVGSKRGMVRCVAFWGLVTKWPHSSEATSARCQSHPTDSDFPDEVGDLLAASVP